ncbi:nitroreductase/quinone reductase family protein [Nocardia sp. NPDC127579]|uniref:nitroreductase/quinone reductase family protein n=1 Tax=Nocardia sp. NPDC127579 TaxID=3345402 RepID=UPI00363E59CE
MRSQVAGVGVGRLQVCPLGPRAGPPLSTATSGRWSVCSGLPRQTPVGGRIVDQTFWMVGDHGQASQYVRNLLANPAVRVKVRLLGTDLLTIRILLRPED